MPTATVVQGPADGGGYAPADRASPTASAILRGRPERTHSGFSDGSRAGLNWEARLLSEEHSRYLEEQARRREEVAEQEGYGAEQELQHAERQHVGTGTGRQYPHRTGFGPVHVTLCLTKTQDSSQKVVPTFSQKVVASYRRLVRRLPSSGMPSSYSMPSDSSIRPSDSSTLFPRDPPTMEKSIPPHSMKQGCPRRSWRMTSSERQSPPASPDRRRGSGTSAAIRRRWTAQVSPPPRNKSFGRPSLRLRQATGTSGTIIPRSAGRC